jgi:hypothetical protein
MAYRDMGMSRTRLQGGLLAGLLLIASAVSTQNARDDSPIGPDSATGHLDVEINDSTVTFRTRDADIRILLEEVAGQSDAGPVDHGDLESRLTLGLEERSLIAALRHLLGGDSNRPAGVGNLTGPQAREGPSSDPMQTSPEDTPETVDLEPGSVSASVDEATQMRALALEATNDDPRTRRQAVREARTLRADLAAPVLALALSDEDEALRAKAIYGLAKIGGPESTAALALAASDEIPWIRAEAIYALATVRDDAAGRMLETALHDPDPEVRRAAIHVIAEDPGDAVVHALSAALQDADPSVREDTVEALGAVGGEAAMEMIRYARMDPDAIVRRAAEQALEEAFWQRQ